jgi:hypothetical protein
MPKQAQTGATTTGQNVIVCRLASRHWVNKAQERTFVFGMGLFFWLSCREILPSTSKHNSTTLFCPVFMHFALFRLCSSI